MINRPQTQRRRRKPKKNNNKIPKYVYKTKD